METPSLNICVAHSDAVVAAGLAAILRDVPGLATGVRRSSLALLKSETAVPDLLVADYATGLALLGDRPRGDAGRRAPKVLIVTQVDREWEVRTAMTAGAHGYLLLSCELEEIHDAVLSIGQGSRYMCSSIYPLIAGSFSREALTAREADVLHLLASGACNKSIARDLDIAIGTVKAHVRGILDKLDASSRTQAVVIATNRGLVRSGPPALQA